MKHLNEKQTLVLAVLLALIIQTGIAFVVVQNTRDLIAAEELVIHSYQVLANLQNGYALIAEGESARRGYILTGDTIFLTHYLSMTAAVETRLQTVFDLTADNPQQQARILGLRRTAMTKAGELQPSIDARRMGLDTAQQAVWTARSRQYMDQLTGQLGEFIGAERALLTDRRIETQNNVQQTVLTIVLGNLFSFGLLGLIFMRLNRELRVRRYAEAKVRNLNNELTVRVAELTRLTQELQDFSYTMSHDLRQPLRGLDGFSQALLDDYGTKLDAQAHDYLRRIRAAAQRMGRLIDDWVSLTRISRLELQRERVNLSALAATIIDGLRSQEPERAVEVSIASDVSVNGDPRLLRLVMDNLLDNAWKFTSRHARARIEFGTAERDGKPFYFVRDDGAGFDPAYGHKLFGPFQRLHGATEYVGTGMGLAMVQRIVARHGGRVWAEGAVESGALFCFTLG